MFTGIVEATGRITALTPIDDSMKLSIALPTDFDDVKVGDSVSINGVCLTAATVRAKSMTADVMGQTLKLTNLGALAVGDSVNLERALAAGNRMGGHVVQGHVDAVGAVISRTAHPQWEVVRISLPASIARYVVPRGSITVDGVSLTVSEVAADDSWFEVSLIPTTLETTVLGIRKTGDTVNLESDVLARHLEKLMRSNND